MQTAYKVGGVTYDSDGHHVRYGHGRVNAFAALQSVSVSSNPVVDVSDRWELGTRAGFMAMDALTNDYEVGLPGAGPIAAPVVYLDWVGSAHLLVDIQLGYSKVWGTSDERRLALALMPAYRLGAFYGGLSLAYRGVEVAGMSTDEWGWGWPR